MISQLASPPQPYSGSSREDIYGPRNRRGWGVGGWETHKSISGKSPEDPLTGRKLTIQGAVRPYRSFLSISRSSCRLLQPGGRPWPQGLESRTEDWELGTQLIGGEVKQVLGLESDRSSLTGVGLILREGFVLLRVATGFPQIPIFKHPQQLGPL